MQRIEIVDWITGFDKVGFCKFLANELDVPARQSYDMVNKEIMNGKGVVLEVDNEEAESVKERIRSFGLVLEGDDKEAMELENLKKNSAPCPYCGKYLRNKAAKQCQHCLMDWHDPARPHRMGR